MMEILEPRQLLATDTWISPTSGSWDVASNWSTGAVPGPGDAVVINVAGASPTVTIGSQVESVRSINAADPLVISKGGLTVSATSTLGGALSMTGGSLTASGTKVVVMVTGATTFSGGNLTAEAGATMRMPGLTAYTVASSTLEASGAGSLLDLSLVTSVTDTGAGDQVEAIGGGTVDLSGLATMTANMHLLATGDHSTLNISTLASFGVGSTFIAGGAALDAENGGRIESGSLTAINGVQMTLSDTAAISVAKLSNIDDSGILVEGGARLSLPLVTSFQGPGPTALEASGVGSELDLANLTRVTNTGEGDPVEAMGGGTVDLSGLATMTANMHLEADGAVSILKIPALTSFSIGSTFIAGKASLTAADGGQISSGSLATINGVSLTLSDTAAISVDRLSNIDDSGVEVEGGAKLSLPLVTSFEGAANRALEANGVGCELDLSHVTSVTDTGAIAQIEAVGGGTVDLGGLATMTANIDLEADGAGSTLKVPALASFSIGSTFIAGGARLTAQDGGVVESGHLAAMNHVQVKCLGGTLELPGGNLTMPSMGTGNIVNVLTLSTGFPIDLGTHGTLVGTTFNIPQGDQVALSAGTYVSAAFNVGQGATLDLTDGQIVTYAGALTASGSGSVQLSSGILEVGLGGLRVKFAGVQFQWTGGSINGSAGMLTNEGTINLSGSADKSFYDDATLDNFGTIIQTGTGNLGLHSDNQSPTVLKIELGASYLIESNSGVVNPFGGHTEILNAGTIEKTAGTGTSTILVNGTLSNTGTIEVDSGTLSLNATIAQFSQGTLTAGTWNAMNGSTLAFPSGTSITTDQANITLGGAGATVAAISGLTTIAGSLSLAGGAGFTTAGDFSNTGSLTIGTRSTLTVGGGYTQGSSGSLMIGIGGAASGNEYGQLAIAGAATLAGSIGAATASGFTPKVGDSFPIMTYASETGAGSVSFVGVNSGALSIFQPIVGPINIVLRTVTNPANLVVQQFSVAPNPVSGQTFSVTYQVVNESQNAATGDWTDSVYLSTQPTLNAGSVPFGHYQHTGGLAAGGQYSGTVSAAVPGLAPDNYYVIVLADSLGRVAELNRAGTELASTNPVQVSLPTLDLSKPPISGNITWGQSLCYQLTVQAGQDLEISAGFAALQGGELYVGYQIVPTPSSNLASSTSPTQATQQVVIPDTLVGTYYVLVRGDMGSGGGQTFTLSAKTLPLQVSSLGPSQAGNSGTTTLTIQGAEFTAGTTVSLVPHSGGTAIAASGVAFQSSTTLFAQFNLTGAAAGAYDVVVTSGGQKTTDPSAFTVTSTARPGHISYNLSVPSISRPGRIAYLTLTYSNDGGSDALAPLFDVSVTSGNATIGLPGQTSFSGSSVQVLGIENTSPAGTLPPGFQGTIEIPYESTTLAQGAGIDFGLQVLTGDSTPMDWSSLESSLQPSYIPNSAWPAGFANLTAEFGPTTASYLGFLDNEATYLSQLGEYTDDVQRLFAFAINTANDALTSGSLDSVIDASFPVPGAIPFDFVRQFTASISGRDTMGPFGLGWTDNWQISASADSQGNVTISDDGSLPYFARNSDGSYTDAPGEYGTLTLTSGAYQYVQTDGTIIAFNPNGSLDYEQDTNRNRITAGYNSSGQLTSLTASNGSAIAIAYNAQGLIRSITDPGGQTTTYTYDASGQHLLTFTDVFGRTVYTYATGLTAADANGLTSLTFADGTGIVWSYDAAGRLATTGRLNGTGPEAEVETYAYPAPGEYTITNADGDTTATFRDDRGNVGEAIDALGNITRYAYDANDNLVKVVAADGTTTTYTCDASGNMTGEKDPMGHSISFTYNGFAEPLTFVNQMGYTTTYQYDASGNLLQTTNPDGTTRQYVYNGLGQVTSSTDPNGQTIAYAYNTHGQLTSENLPDGTSNTYTYDGHGNMLTADGPGGNLMFNYNSQNLPTTIAEPYGTLTVQYGVDGNISQMVDQTGFTVNYGYDAVGRLAKLTDGSGKLIESYTYDPAGNLKSEAKGNGTSTNYQYNADGEITQITNLALGGSFNSKMTYAYNAVGEVTSMTTGGVTTFYEYDADGELTSASSPGDTIHYTYDPAGNRTSVTDNGVATNYVSSDVNEYTSTTTNGVTTTYQYDANGNLIGATTGGQTTSYTFNALNQLTGFSGANGTFSYTYDALGYQISSTADGQTTNNLIDPFGLGNVAAQFDSSGDLVAHFTYGLGLVSQVIASGPACYYDYNLQGSTVGISNSAGVYVNQYSYDPFGQVTTISAGIANPFTFVGQDGVSTDGNGLIDMRARYYDPSTGQFVSNDPLALGGGDTSVRRYSGANPIHYVDPSGLGYGEFVPVNVTAPLFQIVGEGQVSDMGYLVIYPDTPFSYLGDAFVYLPPGAPSYGFPVIEIQQTGLRYRLLPDPFASLSGVPDDPAWGWGDRIVTVKDLFPEFDPPPPDPPVPPSPCVGCGSDNQPPHDPNDLLGPSGYGSAGYFTPGGALPYTIEFSNEKTAQVPADNVVVTEQLSPNLDWSTFQLGTIGFGSYVVDVPPGLTSYGTRVDATATIGVYVDIDVSLNLSTGLLTVTFTSLDPKTLDTPSNPLVGFLPPDTNPPNGEGYINYTIQPKPGLASGAAIDAQASIVFDTNDPIATPQIVNTIDASPPTSAVAALPETTTSPSFTVSWSGSDGAGPGIAGYDIYVSDDGPFTLWQSDTTATSATYIGQPGHTFAFYSVATDPLGLVQPTLETSVPLAITKVINATPTPTPAPTPMSTPTPTPTPSPLVTVTSVREVTNRKHQVTEVLVTFSGAVNAAEADNPALYRLTLPGKKGSYTARNAKVIKLKSAVYDSADDTVMLIPTKPFALKKPVQLVIDGLPPSGLQDGSGRFIDGARIGHPGGNAVATLSRGGASVEAVAAGNAGGIMAVVDALFEQDAFAGLTTAHRTRRP